MNSTEYGKYKLQNGIKISFHQTEESPQVFTAIGQMVTLDTKYGKRCGRQSAYLGLVSCAP